MEENKAYGALKSFVSALEEQMIEIVKLQQQQDFNAAKKGIEEHFERCILAMEARRHTLLSELEQIVQQREKRLEDIEHKLADVITSCHTVMDSGSRFCKQKNINAAEQIWQASLQGYQNEVSANDMQKIPIKVTANFHPEFLNTIGAYGTVSHESVALTSSFHLISSATTHALISPPVVSFVPPLTPASPGPISVAPHATPTPSPGIFSGLRGRSAIGPGESALLRTPTPLVCPSAPVFPESSASPRTPVSPEPLSGAPPVTPTPSHGKFKIFRLRSRSATGPGESALHRTPTPVVRPSAESSASPLALVSPELPSVAPHATPTPSSGIFSRLHSRSATGPGESALPITPISLVRPFTPVSPESSAAPVSPELLPQKFYSEVSKIKDGEATLQSYLEKYPVEGPFVSKQVGDPLVKQLALQGHYVPMTWAPGIEEDILDQIQKFRPFQEWTSAISRIHNRNPAKPELIVDSVHIQHVDVVAGKVESLKYEVSTREWEEKFHKITTFSGVVFMRGETVGILCILIDVETSKEFAFMFFQPRIAVGEMDFPEIPAGVAQESIGELVRELSEAIMLDIKAPQLHDLTHFAFRGKFAGVYQNASACAEFFKLYLYRRYMSHKLIQLLLATHTGESNFDTTKTKVKLVPLEDMWQETPDAKSLVALLLYDKYKQSKSNVAPIALHILHDI